MVLHATSGQVEKKYEISRSPNSEDIFVSDRPNDCDSGPDPGEGMMWHDTCRVMEAGGMMGIGDIRGRKL
uniref:Uncharacterized protein n=1 Tax=Angiostrongylus cantonensis TaxID=6313 RepID=A0A0K0DLK6_ANGCA